MHDTRGANSDTIPTLLSKIIISPDIKSLKELLVGKNLKLYEAYWVLFFLSSIIEREV
jgi:hypothetical protein